MPTPLTHIARKELYRNKPREVFWRKKNSSMTRHVELIESFTKDDYQVYEGLMHRFKKPAHMVKHCSTREYSKPITDLLELRTNERYEHVKVLQVLRHRWTNAHERGITEFNEDTDNFWNAMATSIQKRDGDHLYNDWKGPEGKVVLVDFLKRMFEKQKGLCALSNEEMQLTKLTSGKNYQICSPDRKNSSKRYTPTNIWLVTFWANAMKLDTPEKQFIERVHMIANKHPLKKSINN